MAALWKKYTKVFISHVGVLIMCVACKLTKELHICLHTLVNSVIDMCTVYTVHVNLYYSVYTVPSLPA